MKRLLPLHLGLLAGCVTGFLWLDLRPRWEPPPMVVEVRVPDASTTAAVDQDPTRVWTIHRIEYGNPLWRATEHRRTPPLTPRLRLVDADRTRLRIPEADYNTMWLERVDFRGADLREADFGQSWIWGCDFRDANMEHADLTDARYDAATRWPVAFDPKAHGARLMVYTGGFHFRKGTSPEASPGELAEVYAREFQTGRARK